jgi:hypothetical protein
VIVLVGCCGDVGRKQDLTAVSRRDTTRVHVGVCWSVNAGRKQDLVAVLAETLRAYTSECAGVLMRAENRI